MSRVDSVEWEKDARLRANKDVMPETTIPEMDLIISGGGGRGGETEPPPRGGGGDGEKGGRPRKPPQTRYATAIKLGMISIFSFFLVPSTVFVALELTSKAWVPLHLPKIVWVNTALLAFSSFTAARAGKQLSAIDLAGFRKWWRVTTVLGGLFLAGQVTAWLQLVNSGMHFASNQATSLFYILTGAHGAHLLGGIGALLYVGLCDFEKAKISRKTAAEITSYYWHFMDGLWIFLLVLLYVGSRNGG